VYYKGIDDATAMLAPLGVEVKHLSAGEKDMQTQAEMLKTAVAANPDGLVTTMRDPKSYDPILKPLVDKGVPIMAANIDDPRPTGQRIPYLAYYGEDYQKSGVDLAEAVIANVKKTGGKKPQFALLISPVVGNRGWDDRLHKFGERLAKEYGTKSEQITDLDGNQMGAYLAKNPNVDVICAHESWTWYKYLGVLKGMGKTPGKDVYLACIDVSSGILSYIKDGEVVAAHDEQPYLQGYLPLFDLYLYLTKGKVHPVNVTTGIIIDRSNVDSVQAGAYAGYR
jgi:simple sugar transport system substrate-binding protein